MKGIKGRLIPQLAVKIRFLMLRLADLARTEELPAELRRRTEQLVNDYANYAERLAEAGACPRPESSRKDVGHLDPEVQLRLEGL
ncbi:hypothetical protein [Methylobacterium tarhaniae]|uniref:hypothetical protein n=1 Tax=Methylobacterium tarhaniae TaxID=1187852 RepID=UPI000AE35508|nr:hypothetical protein [Methylobacterium tarhaniae]